MDIELEKLKKLEHALHDAIDILRDWQVEEVKEKKMEKNVCKACAGCPQDEARRVDCSGCKYNELHVAEEPCASCSPKHLLFEPKEACRPFKDCDELVEFWTKRYQTGVRPAHTKPLIWVRYKPKVCELLITTYNKETVCFDYFGQLTTMEELLANFEFLDGKPCGVEVKE